MSFNAVALAHVASQYLKCGSSELGCAVSVKCTMDFFLSVKYLINIYIDYMLK